MSGHLDAPETRQVAAEVELFLKLEPLMTRVRRARALAVAAVRSVNRCNRPTNNQHALTTIQRFFYTP